VYLAFVLMLWHRDDTNLLLVKEGLQRYMVRSFLLSLSLVPSPPTKAQL
jgi:hypothetical protein